MTKYDFTDHSPRQLEADRTRANMVLMHLKAVAAVVQIQDCEADTSEGNGVFSDLYCRLIDDEIPTLEVFVDAVNAELGTREDRAEREHERIELANLRSVA